MAFQILDPSNKPIALNVLDTEAANLWNKEVDPKWYATPLPEGSSYDCNNTNWFDKIGWLIHYHQLNTWLEVKAALIKPFSFGISELREMLPEYDKYFMLVEHWESKGYTPKYVDE